MNQRYAEGFPMEKPTEIFLDPQSDSEMEYAEAVRRKIAGYPDAVVQHKVVKPIIHQSVTEGAEAAGRIIQLRPKPEHSQDEHSQVA